MSPFFSYLIIIDELFIHFYKGNKKMNNKEYWSQADATSTSNYRMIRAKLKKWKLENNITERCVVHHRDDTEECLKYNEEHYTTYKNNGGILKWNDFCKAISNGDITFDMQPITVYTK